MKKTLFAVALILFLLVPSFAGAQANLSQGGTGLATSTPGDLLFGTTSKIRYDRLPIGSNGYVLQSNGSAPQWVSASSLGITNFWTYNSTSNFLSPATTTTFVQADHYIASSTTATSTLPNLSGFLYADGFLQGSTTADIGQRINAAYASLPSTGGTIVVPNGSYSYTTPIVFNTDNKFVKLYCGNSGSASNNAAGGTTLLYTPSTGDAVTFDTNDYIVGASGIENCAIQGTNGTTARTSIGVVVGGSNGAFSHTLRNVDVSGFGTGVYYGSNTSFILIDSSAIHFNGRNISQPDTAGANGENMRITNSVIADANNQAGGATDRFCMYFQESGNVQWQITNTSIDDCEYYVDQFGGEQNVHNFTNVHFENPNLHDYQYITVIDSATNVKINISNSDVMNDTVAGKATHFSGTADWNLSNVQFNSNADVTSAVTRAITTVATSTAVTWSGVSTGDPAITYMYGTVPFSNQGRTNNGLGDPIFYINNSTSTPRIGIGTSTPQTMLHVDGDILSKNLTVKGPNATISLINTNDSSTNAGSQQLTYDSYQLKYVDDTNILYLGKLFLGGSTTIGTTHKPDVLTSADLANVIDDGNSNAWFRGKVGIGTTTAEYPLVVASTTLENLFSITGTGAAIFGSSAGTTGQVLQSNGTGGSPTWVATSSMGTGQVGSGNTREVAFYNATGTIVVGQQVLYVNPTTSRVGIGTLAPTTKLSVDGDMNLVVTGGVNRTIDFGVGLGATALKLYSGGTNLDWGWGLEGGRMVFYAATGGGSNSFKWRDNGALTGGSDLMTLTTAGALQTLTTIRGTKLGAGMVPVSFVDVTGTAANGTIGTESTIRTARATTGGVSFGQAFEIKVGRWKTPTSFSPDTRVDFVLKHASDSTLSGDTTILTMQSNSRSGFGTTTPAANLHVQGIGGEIFRVSTSTNAVLFSIGTDGALFTGGSSPTVGSCGTTPSITGNQSAGTVTTGTAGPTSCVVTFPTTLLGTPEVMINMATTTVFGTVTSKSTSSFTVTFFNTSGSTAYTSGAFNYHVLTR